MPRSSLRRARTPGFTLLELVVVLAVVAVALALTPFALDRGLGSWRLQAATREVRTLMKFARNRAVADHRPLQVMLDRSRNLYWLDRAEASVLDEPPAPGRAGVRLYALPRGVRFGDLTGGAGNPDGSRVGIRFSPRGSSSGGGLEILDARGRGYRITVDPMTARAQVDGVSAR